MPARRSHKKSRYGCDQCRKRRVKCDEKLPLCSTCAHREEPCTYLRRAATIERRERYQRSPRIMSRCQSQAPANACTMVDSLRLPNAGDHVRLGDSPETSTRAREMGLMYHWSTKTCNSFTKAIGDSLQDHIVQEAVRHDFVMEAIFAVTSLHIASDANDMAVVDKHVDFAIHYQHQAVAGLRGALDTLSPQNCDAIFITSTLVMISAIVSSLLGKGPEQKAQSTAEAMLELTSFLHGIQSVLDVARNWISSGPLRCMLNAEINLDSELLCLPVQDLRHANVTQHSGQTRTIFAHAIDMLAKAERLGKHTVPWISNVHPEFLQFLRDGNDLALATFMLWGVLLHQLDDMWWAEISGRYLVDDISCTLRVKCNKWKHIADWSRSQVGLGG